MRRIKLFDFFKKKKEYTLEEKIKWVRDIVDYYERNDLQIILSAERKLSFYFSTAGTEMFTTLPWVSIEIKYSGYVETKPERGRSGGVIGISRSNVIIITEFSGKTTTFQDEEIYTKCKEVFENQNRKKSYYRYICNAMNITYTSETWDILNKANKEYSFFKYPNRANLFRTMEYIQDEGMSLSETNKEELKKYLTTSKGLENIIFV
jgi:hypothetical protein